jgi:hypothetical protein
MTNNNASLIITSLLKKIAKCNKAYDANSKLIKSKFLEKNAKIKIYKTMIRPHVTY